MSTSPHIHTLENGLTLVHEPMPWLPSVSFTMLLPLGAVTDPEGREGAAAVLADWLWRGAGARDSQRLSDALDALGVRRGGGAGKEYLSLSGSLLAESFAEALRLYADIIRRPHLADAEFEGARELARQELEALRDNPTQQLFEALTERFFTSPHGRSSLGTARGLAALTPEALREDYARRAAPKGAILSVAGGVEEAEVVRLVESLFGDWQGEGVPLPEVRVGERRQEHLNQETAQVQVGVAFAAVAPEDPDWYAYALALGALSGGMGARLFSEVREKRGLAYSVAAVSRAVRGFGYTLGYAGTTPERADETLEVVLEQFRHLAAGITPAELERAKTGLLSKLVMQGESSGARASANARDTFLLGRPRSIAEIERAVNDTELETVNGFLAERYHPEFVVLTLGSRPLREVVLA